MINEHDIRDWEVMLPALKLSSLEEGDIFSLHGDNRLFKLMSTANEIAFISNKDIFNSFAVPIFMEVFQCKLK